MTMLHPGTETLISGRGTTAKRHLAGDVAYAALCGASTARMVPYRESGIAGRWCNRCQDIQRRREVRSAPA